MTAVPLIVDLDGTLIKTDMLHECAFRLAREHPLAALQLPLWLAQGKAAMKARMAPLARFDPAALPYTEPFVAWLREQKAQGRRLILCTASDRAWAEPIAVHLGLFDEVIASDGQTNLAGAQKAQRLVERFGERGFDYAGNATPDLAVWRHARRAVLVNAPPALAAQAESMGEVEQRFALDAAGPRAWARVLRLHQWLKNLLIFVPLLAAHQMFSGPAWLALLPAFLAYGLCASAVYIANDLLDLESDRQHPRKRERPFAAGRVPLWQGALLCPLLLAASAALAWSVGREFSLWLALYFVATCAYSWGLKRVVLIDCLILAMLYTLRIIAGAAAANLFLSFWLLAFSVFLFLSLAFVKRYAELDVQLQQGRTQAHGRGYFTSDAPLVQTFGIASGYAAVLVLALYLNSQEVLELYATPELVWAAVPVLLFWVSWMWLQAHRGLMHDDPLIYAVKDRASLAAGAVFAGVLALGTVGWPW